MDEVWLVVVEDRWVSRRATTSIGTPWRIMAVAWLWRSMWAVNPIPVRAAMRPISWCTAG